MYFIVYSELTNKTRTGKKVCRKPVDTVDRGVILLTPLTICDNSVDR